METKIDEEDEKMMKWHSRRQKTFLTCFCFIKPLSQFQICPGLARAGLQNFHICWKGRCELQRIFIGGSLMVTLKRICFKGICSFSADVPAIGYGDSLHEASNMLISI